MTEGVGMRADRTGEAAVKADFPDLGTLRSVLTLAARAPSIHNTQPWRWRVGDAGLDLYSQPDLQLHSTDPDGRDLIISCGAALHHCVVALGAMGWQAKVHRFPTLGDPLHLATIETRPHIVPRSDLALAAAIPRRRTDRRAHGSPQVAGGDIALMAARAARSGVMLRQVDTIDRMKTIVAQAIPERLFAATGPAQPSAISATDDNGAILALGTKSDDRLARLRAGEAASLVLLTATAMGLATCPITEPLEIWDTREAIRSDVFGADGHPQMLLRVGFPPFNADPLPATPRRDLSDVVEWPAGFDPFGSAGSVAVEESLR